MGMWRLLLVLVVGCAPVRVPDAERFPQTPRRLALAVQEPRRLVEVDGVALAVHDSAPESALPVLLCLHAIGHGGGDFAGVEAALHDSYRVPMPHLPVRFATRRSSRASFARSS
jgi:hypothetical protein